MNELKAVLAAFLAGQAEFAQVDSVLVRSLQRDPTIAPSAFAAIDQIYRSGRLPLQLYVLLKNRIAQSHAAARAHAPPSSSTPPPSAPTPPPSAPAAPPAPAPPPAPQDRTIFSPSAAAAPPSPSQTPPPAAPAQPATPPLRQAPPPAPPPRVAAEPPSARAPEPEAPPSDRTIMRGRPPPRAPGVSQPHGGAQRSFEGEPEAAGPVTGPGGPATGPVASPTGPFDLGHSTGPSETSHTGGANTGRTSNTGAGTTGTGKTGTGSSSWTDPAKWEDRPQVALERGSVLKGRFVLENVVGRGGMGVVFRAKDLRKEEAQDRDPYVAVKILNDEFRRHPESLKALQREARKSQQLAHPNIVSVFDFDRDGGTVYMTMEFLEGEPLDKIIKNPQFEGMALGEAYPLVRGLGSALSYAHDKGIVHSDFKPGNCFLTKSGVIKVFDFGIAQAAKLKGSDLHGEETKFDAGSLGALTPAYASCEMIAGEQPDTRDDIYALGCVVYELLTGKHPFSKKSAADARDQKLVPAPIKRLTRRQWRAIEKSLAFRRADRTASVWELVDGLAKHQLFTAPRIAVGAAAIVVFGVGAYFGVNAWQQAQRDRLVAALSSRNDAQVLPALDRLAGLVPDDRDALLQQVNGPLLDWYESRMNAAADKANGRYDYPRAAAIAEEAKRWYSDSARIASGSTRKAQEGADLAVSLVGQFKDALQAGRLLPDPANTDVAEVLEILSQVQPDNETLKSPSLAIAYATQASDALRAKDVARATVLLETGLGRFPDNEQLVSVQARLADARKTEDDTRRLAELKKTLDDSTGQRVADLVKLESAVNELVNLSPDDASLRGYRGRLTAALGAEVKTAIDARDWDAAQRLVDGVDDTLLPVELKRDPQNQITTARASYDRRRQDLLAAIESAANAGRLTDAQARLSELGTLADADTVQKARDRVLQGYVAVAQRQTNAGQFDEATKTVDQGRALEQSYPDLVAMVDTIATSKRAAEQQGAAAAQAERERAARALHDDAQKILDKTPFTFVDARDALNKIKQLPEGDSLGGAAGTDQVAKKLASQALAAGTSSQQWQQAVAQLDQALDLIPASSTLQGARDEAQRNLQTLRDREKDQRVATLVTTLGERMANAPGDDAWIKGVRDLIGTLRGLVPDGDPRVADAERSAATALVARAGEARDRKNFAEADRLLRAAGGFAPRLEALAAEQQRVAEAKDAASKVVVSEQQARDARVADLKSEFDTQVKADNPSGAVDARNALAKELPANDPYLGIARQRIADVYLHVATQRLADKDLTGADRFAQQGLRELPSSQALQALAANIADARNQEQTRAAGVTLERDIDTLRAQIQTGGGDPAEAKSLRERIRSAAPAARFSTLDNELVAIADQRLATNPGDDTYRVFAATSLDRAFARPAPISDPKPTPTLPPPASAPIVACTDQLKGSKRLCYDAVPGATSGRGPNMVVVPGGAAGVSGSYAIGRNEVTVSNWNDYCKLGNLGAAQCTPVGGDANNPIANVAVADIEKYAAWLTATTKVTYRLPTRAEWVHAATATGKPGGAPNCIDASSGRGKAVRTVDRDAGNDWGVRDAVGNVQELVKTESGYEVRGGHFNMALGQCSVDRAAPHDGRPEPITGFRLVRDLGPAQ